MEILQFKVMYENCRQSYELQKAFEVGIPLHEAAEMGKLDTRKVLFANGADPAVMGPRRETVLDRAERAGRKIGLR